MTTEAKKNFFTATDRAYAPVALAGSGKDGDVWYAISTRENLETIKEKDTDVAAVLEKRTITASISSNQSTVEPSKPLMPQLYAVKLPKQGQFERCAAEVRLLERLRVESVNKGHVCSRFPQLLDSDKLNTHESTSDENDGTDDSKSNKKLSCRWFVMTAIVGFQLSKLRTAAVITKKTFPKELVAHIAIQLHETLAWLHNLDPPVLHRDLWQCNIMMDPSSQEIDGFPNVVVVDFGSAVATRDPKLHSWERGTLYTLLYTFATMNISCEPANHCGNELKRCHCDVDWIDFVRMMGIKQSALYENETIRLDEFRARFLVKLHRKIENIMPVTKAEIRQLVDYASGMMDGVSEGDICRAIADVKVLNLR